MIMRTLGENPQNLQTSTGENQNLRVRLYRGPLPKLPTGVDNTWIALHSPVRMYIPIRYAGDTSSNSPDCVLCPKNFTIHLTPRQKFVQMPLPTLSICASIARRPGRVHVAIASGPRPGERLNPGIYPVEVIIWKAEGAVHSCQYTLVVKGRKKTLFRCLRPTPPAEGVLLCDSDDGSSTTLPPNTVCQFFCPEGSSGSATVICSKNGWSPQLPNMSCVATTCPAPINPDHGTWECNRRKASRGYNNGTFCTIQCKKGFILSTPRLENARIVCNSPKWNQSEQKLPHCKATFCPSLPPPTLGSWECDRRKAYGGYSNGTYCKVRCKKGFVVPTSRLDYAQILCNSPQWNRTRDKMPHCKRAFLPKLYNCRDHWLFITVDQKAKLSEDHFPSFTTHTGRSVMAKCTLNSTSELLSGEYRNECIAKDPEIRTQKKCRYTITVQERLAPQPMSGQCDNRTVLANENGTYQLSSDVLFEVLSGGISLVDPLPGNCTPQGELRIGEYTVHCEAIDVKTKMQGSCDFGLAVTAPKLVNECKDLVIETSAPVNISVPFPTVLTHLNKTFNATCFPYVLTEIGDFNVSCTFLDGSICHYTITVVLEDQPTTITSVDQILCLPLESPMNGFISCTTEGDACDISCDDGYGFPEGETVLRLQCNLDSWTLQGQKMTHETIPGCIVQIESSAVQLWISFEAVSPHCDQEFEEVVTGIINAFCQPYTECLQTVVNCTLDEENDAVLVSVNWTVQADFEPEDYTEEEVPEAETRLESVLDRVRNFVAEAESVSNFLSPIKDSLRRGHMTLVCPEGFVANMLLAKCVK